MNRQSRRHVLLGGLSLAGLSLLTGCRMMPSLGQRSLEPRRIGCYSNPVPTANAEAGGMLVVFRQALGDLGYVEGQNLVIEERYASGADQRAIFAAEVERFRPEVIVVPASIVAQSVRDVTSTIPIVSVGQGSLLERRLVESLAHPGGNVTGLSTPLLAGKPLQLLKEAVPSLSRVAVLFDTTISVAREPYERAAEILGLQLTFVGAGGPADFESAFQIASHDQVDGLFITTGPLFSSVSTQTRIDDLAVHYRLPSMWGTTDAVSRVGLLGYGPNRADLFRRTAIYVDKILTGANPAEMPVEQPTLFDFLINLKTARSLGLTIPSAVLAQATEVIQ
ncbi:MAG: ABC transporter substrate-binding protein [Chloroflexota bacterium]